MKCRDVKELVLDLARCQKLVLNLDEFKEIFIFCLLRSKRVGSIQLLAEVSIFSIFYFFKMLL